MTALSRKVARQKVFKAGNSLVISIPSRFRRNLGIKVGDLVEIKTDVDNQKIICKFPSSRQLTLINRK